MFSNLLIFTELNYHEHFCQQKHRLFYLNIIGVIDGKNRESVVINKNDTNAPAKIGVLPQFHFHTEQSLSIYM